MYCYIKPFVFYSHPILIVYIVIPVILRSLKIAWDALSSIFVGRPFFKNLYNRKHLVFSFQTVDNKKI